MPSVTTSMIPALIVINGPLSAERYLVKVATKVDNLMLISSIFDHERGNHPRDQKHSGCYERTKDDSGL